MPWLVSFSISAGCSTFYVAACLDRGIVSYLEAQDLGLHKVQRLSVDLDQALTSLHSAQTPRSAFRNSLKPTGVLSNQGGRTNLALGDSSSRLLLAEALHTLHRRRRRRHDCGVCVILGEKSSFVSRGFDQEGRGRRAVVEDGLGGLELLTTLAGPNFFASY